MEIKTRECASENIRQFHRDDHEKSPFILYEDAYMIVCRKPAGIPVQTRHLTQTDMESLLKKHLLSEQTPSRKNGTDTKNSRSPKTRPANKFVEHKDAANENTKNKDVCLHIIHRLDTFVEGIVLFAKTKHAAAALSSLIRDRKIEKRYRAVVTGIPPASGTLEHYMKKDPRTNTAVLCGKQDPHAKYARLTYTRLDSSEHFSKVDILLDTGRFHQIRLQFQSIGHPLAGDRKYTASAESAAPASARPLSSGAPGYFRAAVHEQPPRTAAYEHVQLLAYSLRFPHPVTGKKMTFTLPDTLILK